MLVLLLPSTFSLPHLGILVFAPWLLPYPPLPPLPSLCLAEMPVIAAMGRQHSSRQTFNSSSLSLSLSLSLPPSLQTMDEIDVAIKTCKPDASAEDKAKFLEEAGAFVHVHITL